MKCAGAASWSLCQVLRLSNARAFRFGSSTPKALSELSKTYLPTGESSWLAHSGAGMLLPAIRQVTGRRVAAYLFVDAMIPENMKSRLDLFASPEAATRFRQSAKNGYLPVWTDEDLREDIPDNALRRRFVNELRPLPLAVYEEPIPVFSGWPDAPCGYLQFTPTYEFGKRRAETSGWIYSRMNGGHFPHARRSPRCNRRTHKDV
jgi:hypothetical protein